MDIHFSLFFLSPWMKKSVSYASAVGPSLGQLFGRLPANFGLTFGQLRAIFVPTFDRLGDDL